MNSSVSEKAYDHILDMIYKGKIKMGDPINELALSNELGMSRSPVREALKSLEAKGMVVYYPGRGNFAAEFTWQDVDEIFDLRSILETAAIKRSAGHIPDVTLNELRDMVEGLKPGETKAEEFYAADRKLHGAFVNYCGNSRLIEDYRSLMLQIELIRRISARKSVHFTKSKKYHLDIINALLAGDAKKAADILEAHLDEVRRSTVEVMKYKEI